MIDYLIIACSGRALAASAKRAGYKIGVADFFADEDTKQVSQSTYRLPCDKNSFDEKALLSHAQDVLLRYPHIKFVLGSGFESNPGLLDSLGKLAPVLSNSKESIIAIKKPQHFFSILKKYEIAYPDFSLTKPNNAKKYLIKKNAGMGGVDVNWAKRASLELESDHYFQAFVSGSVFSVVFLANGKRANIVGFNQQLQTNDFPETPFLYRGAICLNPAFVEKAHFLHHIVNVITREFGLKGLCGLDYILNEQGEIIVLEINPRPPATFELHEEGQSLFDAHVACFDGTLAEYKTHKTTSYKAYAILYAKQDSLIRRDLKWPDWVKDRPTLGTTIAARFPICTVHAKAFSLDELKAILFNRLQQIEMKSVATENAA